jgi:DNA adenine methylase
LQTYLPSIFRKDHEVTYVEPFVGGGAMLFFMLSTYPSIKRAVVNDINPDLIIAYQTIKDSPEQLIDYLSSIQNDYYKFKEEEERRNFYLSMRLKYNQKGLSKIENNRGLDFS